jgi:hypothetical protein|tara:strand:- start:297 stop:491 length:195 start_codon:yes stop_codon:yes gene_type:complete
MQYVDYKFEMTEAGLTFTDMDKALEPNCLLKIENTPFTIGDTFTLTHTIDGQLFFKRVDASKDL